MAMKPYPLPITFGELDSETEMKESAQIAIRNHCDSVKVLFDKITLGPGTYTEDEAAPEQASGKRWVTYKLNELGWFAGPLDSQDDAQLKRAVWRYSHAHPNLDATENPDDSGLATALGNGDERRPLTDKDGALAWSPDEAPPATAKVVIDHDLYVVTRPDGDDKSPTKGEAMRVDGMQWIEAKHIDRFETPLEVTVYLRNAAGEPVLIPQGMEMLGVRWNIHEVEENCPINRGGSLDKDRTNAVHFVADATSLPPFSTENLSGDQVVTKVITGPGKEEDYPKRSKAGVLFRGSFQGGDKFKVSAELALTDHELEHLRKEHQSWDRRMVPTTSTLTIWRRVQVAGDLVVGHCAPADVNWNDVVKAFEPANMILVKPLAKNISAWAFGSMSRNKYKQKIGAKDDAEPPTKKVYRLTFEVLDPVDADKGETVAATVDNDPITPCRKHDGKYLVDFRAIDYIRGETSRAHAKIFAKVPGRSAWVIFTHAIGHDVIGLDGEMKKVKRVSDRTGAPAFLQAGEYIQASSGPAGPFVRVGKLLTVNSTKDASVIDNDHISYIDVAAKGDTPEAEYLTLIHQDGVNSLYKGGGYHFGPLFGLGEALHESRPDKRPGIIVLRGIQVPGALADSELRKTRKDLFREGTSIGLDNGLVLLDSIQFHDYDDVFLVSHEIGHTLYLTHPFDVKVDHDDKNCMMNYPKNTGLGRRNGARPKFCGKCVKKLKGWTIAGGTPEQPKNVPIQGEIEQFDDKESHNVNKDKAPSSRSLKEAKGKKQPQQSQKVEKPPEEKPPKKKEQSICPKCKTIYQRKAGGGCDRWCEDKDGKNVKTVPYPESGSE